MSGYRTPTGEELGSLIEDVRPKRVVAFVVYGLMLLFGVGIMFGALVQPPKKFDEWIIFVLFGVGFTAASLAGFFGRKPDRVLLHERGFVVRNRPVLWEDVVELRTKRRLDSDGRRSVLDLHTLRLRNGETLELRIAFVNSDAVLEHFREKTREHLLREPSASFGPIALDDAGVRTDVTTLSWSQIARAGFDGPMNNVIIRGPGSAWIEVPLADVPNAHVLCALVNARAKDVPSA